MKRRISAILAAGMCCAAFNAYAAPEQAPNMVVVLVDDHAFEAISAYGTYLKDHAKTPTIDRLAK